jgi:hypothetical protein
MAYKREDILAAIYTKLLTITTANGYENTITNITRYPDMPDEEVLAKHFSSGTPMVLLLDGNPERYIQEKSGEHLSEFNPVIVVYCASNVTTASTTMNSILGDFKKLILNNRLWTSSTVHTSISNIIVLEELSKPHAGFRVETRVVYIGSDANP